MELLTRRMTFMLVAAIMTVSCSINDDTSVISMDDLTESSVHLRGIICKTLPDSLTTTFIICDSVVVSQRHYHEGDHVLGLTYINDTSFLWFGQYGIEEDRMMNSLVTRCENRVLLYDIVKEKITVIDVSTGIDNPSIISYDTGLSTQYVLPVTMRKGLFLAHESFKGKRRRVRTTGDEYQPDRHNVGRYDAFNVVLGELACSNVRNRSVFADRVDSKVEILDTDGKLLKRIMFISQGDKERQQYSKDESEGVTYYTFLGSVKQSFTDVCCNDSTIALLYRPGLITPSSVSISDHPYVVLMDWDGNVRATYVMDDEFDRISITSDGRCLFCFSSREGGNSVMRYDLTE